MNIDIDAAILAATEGKKITEIAAAAGVTHHQLYAYEDAHPGFAERLASARNRGLEKLADDLLDVAKDESLDVQRAKLHSDNVKWILARRKRKEYGDQIDVTVTERVDLTGAIIEAKRRAQRLTCDSALIEDAQVVDSIVLPANRMPDVISVAPISTEISNPFED